jgi:hypothetical protein
MRDATRAMRTGDPERNPSQNRLEHSARRRVADSAKCERLFELRDDHKLDRKTRIATFFQVFALSALAFPTSVRRGRGGDSMLPPWIIEQIRERETEQERARIGPQPRLELPLEPLSRPSKAEDDEPDPDRGVVVVDLG